MNFNNFGLDASLIKSLKSMRINTPTEVQKKVLPLAFQKKNILTRAKTGSGKTLAFTLPIVQQLMTNQKNMGLILVPTRELCKQIEEIIKKLLQECNEAIDVFSISGAQSLVSEIPRLKENPNLIIATPARLSDHLLNAHISLINLSIICIDEADLILSYGYEKDIKFLVENLPVKGCQFLLMSATFNENVLKLKKLMLHNPVILNINELNEIKTSLSEFYSFAKEEEKFLYLFGFFKLRLIKGKVLIFVKNIFRAYKLCLFLEKFNVSVSVLNDELPYNTRLDIIKQFNSGILDLLIVTDNCLNLKQKKNKVKDDIKEIFIDYKNNYKKNRKEKVKVKQFINKERLNKEKCEKKDVVLFDISRGVDFREVNVVINFDFPNKVKNYVHRVGRTARGGNSGLAISLIDIKTEKALFNAVQMEKRNGIDSEIQPMSFKLDSLKPVKYRVRCVYESLTKQEIKKFRIREIEVEFLNSKKLRNRFARSKELELIRHDKFLKTTEIDKNLSVIPKYLMDQFPFKINENSECQIRTRKKLTSKRNMFVKIK